MTRYGKIMFPTLIMCNKTIGDPKRNPLSEPTALEKISLFGYTKGEKREQDVMGSCGDAEGNAYRHAVLFKPLKTSIPWHGCKRHSL